MIIRAIFLSLLYLSFASASLAHADDGESVLKDGNGDGVVKILAFGDSTTYGLGDGGFGADAPPAPLHGGYPGRLEHLLNTPVLNRGLAAEEMTTDGIERFPNVVGSSDSDIVIIFEGSNDAFRSVTEGTYSRALQRAVNIAKTQGKTPVIATLPTPCCEHGQLGAFTVGYSGEARHIAEANGSALVDLEKAWRTTCQSKDACELFTLPEGLHPNGTGYDVISQTAAAALLGIDIFVDGGSSELEQALGVDAGTVIVKPEVAAQ